MRNIYDFMVNCLGLKVKVQVCECVSVWVTVWVYKWESVSEKIVYNTLVWVAVVILLSQCGVQIEYRDWLLGDENDESGGWKNHLKMKRERGEEKIFKIIICI